MNIDLRTAVLLRRRAESSPILLFHEVRTPARRRNRIDRLRRWMGPWLWRLAGAWDDGVPEPGPRHDGRYRPARHELPTVPASTRETESA